MRLRGPMLFVKDLERMTQFYADGVGLTMLPDLGQPGWTELDAGGTTVGLHAIPDEIAQQIEISLPPEARSDTPIKLRFEATDLAQAIAHLTVHGAVMFEPTPWGSCDGLDPEGNVFQIVQA